MDPADEPRNDEVGGKVNAVYIMASGTHGTLYIGVTSDLLRRFSQHREGVHDGFTKRYRVTRLVWLEWHDSIEAAIHREKRLKEWPRAWKLNLIERENPRWLDLFPGFFVAQGPFSHLQEVPPAL